MSSFGHLFYKIRVKVNVVDSSITDVFSTVKYFIDVIIHHALLKVNANNFLV